MPKFTKGPYTAEPDHEDEHYTAICSKAGNWGGFAKFVTKGAEDTPSAKRMAEEGAANIRLYQHGPVMFDFLVRYVVEHGKRGGLYDQLLPAAEQPSEVRRAMTIIAEIEGEPL